ncbi:hypothetical protein CcaverHIS002_0509230 [Cutaneotrichosporon cavernicola]|nr:hypothetical protein CcaverHIS002_0509230 [Cutaneotrichosporon cavernicola]
MSQHYHTPFITLPSLPNPVHSVTSFGSRTPQRLSRPDGLAPWDAFDDENDMGPNHGIPLPIQHEVDRAACILSLPTPPFSRSTFFLDSERSLSGESVIYSDDMGDSDTFGAREAPDWAPWLSHSGPSSHRRSHMLDDVLAPPLLDQSRPGPRRPILKTSPTFYLPPLYTDQRPTFAIPRRAPRPSSRTSTSTSSTSSSKTRDGCFSSCIGRNKTTPHDKDKGKALPARRPSIAPRGKHYRISFVQDRQWRANILNQAVEESLTNAILPMPPKPCKSKYDPRPATTHRNQGIPDKEPPIINRSTERVPSPAAGRGHDTLAGLSFGTTDATTTATKSTTPGAAKLEPGPEPEAVVMVSSSETENANDGPPDLQEPPTGDVPSSVVCPSLRHIYMFPEDAMERLTRGAASLASPLLPPAS